MEAKNKSGKGDSVTSEKKLTLSPRSLKRNMIAHRRRRQDKVRTDTINVNLDAQGRTAIKALQKYYSEQKKQSKSALFPEIDFALHLVAVYKKAARVTKNDSSANRKIQLPFPLQSAETSTVCLIVRDLHMTEKDYNDPDVDKQAREWKEKLLREQNITGAEITKILTRRQMEREYHTYADKRSLASAYDLFLVDNTVMKVVQDMCGKEFHKANKYPIAVKTNRPLIPQISKAFRIALLPLFKLKNRVSIKIGHLGQPLDELAKNLNECVIQLRLHCPGGTGNIQSLYLQPTSSSPSLPIYVDLAPRNEVAMETPKERKERLMEEKKLSGSSYISGELSTLPEGLDKVVVHPNGRVRVLKGGKEVVYPTMDDEHEERDDILPLKKTQRSAEAIAKTSEFHRTQQKAIWNAKKEAKEKKATQKKGQLTPDDKDAAQFKFRPIIKMRKSRNKKSKSAKLPVENGDGSEHDTAAWKAHRKRKGGKKGSVQATAAPAAAAGAEGKKTTAVIAPAVAQPKRKKRKVTESAA